MNCRQSIGSITSFRSFECKKSEKVADAEFTSCWRIQRSQRNMNFMLAQHAKPWIDACRIKIILLGGAGAVWNVYVSLLGIWSAWDIAMPTGYDPPPLRVPELM
jgi:hypothetical protein